jgi:hypothetical protein
MATTTYGSPYVDGTDLVANWPAASLTVAQSIDAAGYYIGRGINAQVASYTAVLTDAGKTITMTAAGANTVTIPANASVAYVIGTRINILNLGAGACTPTAGAGVTINGTITALATNESAALIKTATNTWSYLVAGTPGLSLVTPTSVAGTGVTLSGGAVSFSASSTVSVNGCFTATYDNYRIYLANVTNTVSEDIRLRWRVAGADNTTTNYRYAGIQTSTAASNSAVGESASSYLRTGYFTTGRKNILTGIDVLTPFLSAPTGTWNSAFDESSGTGYATITTCSFAANTSFDGFTVYPTSGTITGTLRVYGLRNS